MHHRYIGDNIAAFIGHIGKGISLRRVEGKVGLFDFGSSSRTACQQDKQQGKENTGKFVQAHFTTSFQYNALAKWFDLRAFNRLRSCFPENGNNMITHNKKLVNNIFDIKVLRKQKHCIIIYRKGRGMAWQQITDR